MKYKKTLLAISSLLLAGAAFAGDAINVTIHNNTAQAYTFNDMGTKLKSLSAGQDAAGRCSLVPVNPVTDNIPPNSTVTLQMLSSQTMATISTKVNTPVSGKRDLDLLNIYPSGGNDQDSRNVLFSSISEKIGAPYDSNSPAIASVIIKNVNTTQVGTFDTRFSKLTPSVSGTCHADIAGVEDKNIICKLNNVGDNSVSITINPLILSK